VCEGDCALCVCSCVGGFHVCVCVYAVNYSLLQWDQSRCVHVWLYSHTLMPATTAEQVYVCVCVCVCVFIFAFVCVCVCVVS